MTRWSHRCERARSLASLAADGELTELEAVSLEAHVARCAPCAAYATELQALVATLRAAPPVQPDVTFFRPAARRRSPVRALQYASAAAAVVAAVGLGHFAASLSSPKAGTGPVASAASAAREAPFEQSLLAMLARQLPHGRTVAA